MIGHFPAVLNFNRLFLKLNRFICNLAGGKFSPFIVMGGSSILFFSREMECQVVMRTARPGFPRWSEVWELEDTIESWAPSHSSHILQHIFLRSWTSTGYFSTSTGSSVISGKFSPVIVMGGSSILFSRGMECRVVMQTARPCFPRWSEVWELEDKIESRAPPHSSHILQHTWSIVTSTNLSNLIPINPSASKASYPPIWQFDVVEPVFILSKRDGNWGFHPSLRGLSIASLNV